MIALYGNVLGLLHIVDALENGQSMADTRNPHGFQVIVQQSYQGLADNLVFCQPSVSQSARSGMLLDFHPPRKRSEYCSKPMVATKSAHSSAVHSVMIVSGRRSALLRWP